MNAANAEEGVKELRARGRCCSACLAGFVWEAALLSLPDVCDLHCAYAAPVKNELSSS